MTNNLTILNKLEKLIGERLNDYLDKVDGLDIELPKIIDKNVMQDFPDVDSMRCPTMFWVLQTYSENEELTTNSDFCTMNVSVFLTCRRNKAVNLQKMVNGYTAAFEMFIWHNQSLDNLVDMCNVTSADFYPAVQDDPGVSGVEISLQIQYQKIYC